MRLVIKFLVIAQIFLKSAYGSKIILQYEVGQKDNALYIQKLLMTKYSIPYELTELSVREKCSRRQNRFLELCINKKGELITLSSNLSEKTESLKVFSKDI